VPADHLLLCRGSGGQCLAKLPIRPLSESFRQLLSCKTGRKRGRWLDCQDNDNDRKFETFADVTVTLMLALNLSSKETSELLLKDDSLTFVIETLIVVPDLAFLPMARTPRVIF
jgi:hypothetical protein